MEPNSRLLALLGLLRSSTVALSFAAIREALAPVGAYTGAPESARRKFERDKAALRELGVILEWDAARSAYRIAPESLRVRPLALSVASIAVFRQAAAMVTRDPGSPFAPDVRGALVRLLGVEEPAVPTAVVAHRSTEDGMGVRNAVRSLTIATWRRLPVRFTYEHVGGGAPTAREIHPWGLFARRRHWYLVGFCTDHRAERCFRVDLVDRVQVVGLPDGAPRFERPQGFDIRKRAQLPAWDWPLADAVDVVLEVDHRLAPLLARTLGGARMLEGGRLARSVTNTHAVLDLAWKWLPHVRVVAPETLAHEWQSRFDAVGLRHGVGS